MPDTRLWERPQLCVPVSPTGSTYIGLALCWAIVGLGHSAPTPRGCQAPHLKHSPLEANVI
jgi:hypothetical protein